MRLSDKYNLSVLSKYHALKDKSVKDSFKGMVFYYVYRTFDIIIQIVLNNNSPLFIKSSFFRFTISYGV